MKKFAAGLFVGIMVMSGTIVFADTIEAIFGQVGLVVDGKAVEEETLLYDGTTYVPLRAVSEVLGKEVNYDWQTETAYIGELPADVVIEPMPVEEVSEESSETGFYAEFPSVPDFGEYMGVEPVYLKTEDGLTTYEYEGEYSESDTIGYEQLLEENGFEHFDSQEGFVGFANGEYGVAYYVETEAVDDVNGILVFVVELK